MAVSNFMRNAFGDKLIPIKFVYPFGISDKCEIHIHCKYDESSHIIGLSIPKHIKVTNLKDTFNKAYIDSDTGWYNVTRFKKDS